MGSPLDNQRPAVPIQSQPDIAAEAMQNVFTSVSEEIDRSRYDGPAPLPRPSQRPIEQTNLNELQAKLDKIQPSTGRSVLNGILSVLGGIPGLLGFGIGAFFLGAACYAKLKDQAVSSAQDEAIQKYIDSRLQGTGATVANVRKELKENKEATLEKLRDIQQGLQGQVQALDETIQKLEQLQQGLNQLIDPASRGQKDNPQSHLMHPSTLTERSNAWKQFREDYAARQDKNLGLPLEYNARKLSRLVERFKNQKVVLQELRTQINNKLTQSDGAFLRAKAAGAESAVGKAIIREALKGHENDRELEGAQERVAQVTAEVQEQIETNLIGNRGGQSACDAAAGRVGGFCGAMGLLAFMLVRR